MAGINGMFLPWLKVGGLLVQHHPFDLATFLRQISEHRATYTCAPPALLTALLQNEALLAQTDISSLRILGSGSTPLAPSLLQGWHDRHGIEIINFYGSNEGIALLGTPKDIPRSGGARAVLPPLPRPGLGVHDGPHHAGADRGPADRRRDHAGGCPGRAAYQGARRVPRLPAGQRRARPVRRGRLPADRGHP